MAYDIYGICIYGIYGIYMAYTAHMAHGWHHGAYGIGNGIRAYIGICGIWHNYVIWTRGIWDMAYGARQMANMAAWHMAFHYGIYHVVWNVSTHGT